MFKMSPADKQLTSFKNIQQHAPFTLCTFSSIVIVVDVVGKLGPELNSFSIFHVAKNSRLDLEECSCNLIVRSDPYILKFTAPRKQLEMCSDFI